MCAMMVAGVGNAEQPDALECQGGRAGAGVIVSLVNDNKDLMYFGDKQMKPCSGCKLLWFYPESHL